MLQRIEGRVPDHLNIGRDRQGLGGLPAIEHFGRVLIAQMAEGGASPADAHTEDIRVRPSDAQSCGQACLQRRGAAVGIAGPEEWQPALVEKFCGTKGQAPAFWYQRGFSFIGVPVGQMDIVEIDSVLGRGPTDLDMLEILVFLEKRIEAMLGGIPIGVGEPPNNVNVASELLTISTNSLTQNSQRFFLGVSG